MRGKIKKVLEVSKGNLTYKSGKKKGNDENFVALFYFIISATLIAPFSWSAQIPLPVSDRGIFQHLRIFHTCL